MANKIPRLGNFSIPSVLIDYHEWMIDELIDGVTGQVCELSFPDKDTQCDNCKISPDTKRSSNIYNGTGPNSFANFGICPRCAGLGRFQVPVTETIRLRIYWDSKSWIKIGVSLATPDSSCMTIGYMTDLPKLERAKHILLPADVSSIRRYEMNRVGEAVPHGFRQDRYFIQFFTRIGSGG